MFYLLKLGDIKYMLVALITLCFISSSWIVYREYLTAFTLRQKRTKLFFRSKNTTAVKPTLFEKNLSEFVLKTNLNPNKFSVKATISGSPAASLLKFDGGPHFESNILATISTSKAPDTNFLKLDTETNSKPTNFSTSFTLAISIKSLSGKMAVEAMPQSNGRFENLSNTVDPKSRFYGMTHMNSYGRPLSKSVSFDDEWEDWKTYFPELLSNMKKQKNMNPNRDSRLFTHSASVKVEKILYSFRDNFTATITSLDGFGKPKTFGGDLYRSSLLRDHTVFSDGIPCRVIDNNDGTYTIEGPLVMNGILKLNVTLVNTIEGIMEIINRTDNVATWGLQFLGVLESGEVVKCNMSLPQLERRKDLSYCDYSNPRNKAPFFCDKPPSGVCTQIVNLHYGNLDKKASPKNTTLNFNELCKRHGCYKKIDPKISILVNHGKRKTTLTSLPSCRKQFQQNAISPSQVSGYFENQRWWSLTCASELKSYSPVRRCLNNKVVYFFGDSTVRKFFYFLASLLNLDVDGPNTDLTWHHPKIAFPRSSDYNLTLYFRAHGPPFFNTGTLAARPYMSDLIIDIPRGGRNVFVIFNIGVHFHHHHPNIYIHRIKGIKRAIIEHHKKFPETKFIFKGLNVVRRGNEWITYRFETILRKIFRHLDNSVYLNLWDLTTVWPLNNDYHPQPRTEAEEALQMLNYLCAQ